MSQATAIPGAAATTAGGRRDRFSPPRLLFGAAVLALAVAFPFVVEDTTTVRMISLGIILAIGAMGLNILTGFTGQISIGHYAFSGIGAYITAQLMAEQSLTFFSTLPVAIGVCAAIGALVGLPALRVHGPALALVTLGLALLVPTLLQKFGTSGGGVALWRPERKDLASPIDSLTDTQWKYLVPLAALVIVYVLTRNLVNSRAGRAMIAVRDQEVAATTAGVNVAGTKIAAFAISAAYCGLAGSLGVLVRGQADASSALVYFQISIFFLIAVVVGGTATVAGPIIGGIVVQVLDEKAPEWGGDRVGLAPFILGVALIVIVYFLPGGILGGIRQAWAKVGVGRPRFPGPAPSTEPVPNPKEPT
jgi:branched-chain amino acid transport system permease protein